VLGDSGEILLDFVGWWRLKTKARQGRDNVEVKNSQKEERKSRRNQERPEEEGRDRSGSFSVQLNREQV
jgi:hypothetical protein